jgi:hypothetical protein
MLAISSTFFLSAADNFMIAGLSLVECSGGMTRPPLVYAVTPPGRQWATRVRAQALASM